jgi:hypothetical protein
VSINGSRLYGGEGRDGAESHDFLQVLVSISSYNIIPTVVKVNSRCNFFSPYANWLKLWCSVFKHMFIV